MKDLPGTWFAGNGSLISAKLAGRDRCLAAAFVRGGTYCVVVVKPRTIGRSKRLRFDARTHSG